jgi:hypothetical protein
MSGRGARVLWVIQAAAGPVQRPLEWSGAGPAMEVSLVAQGSERIQRSGAAGRDETGQQRDDQ